MQKLNIVHVDSFTDNYIWILIDSNKQCAIVVDPGEARPVIEYLQANNLTLAAILITHHHYDHTNGAKALKKIYNCPVYGPKNSSFTELSDLVQEGSEIIFDWLSSPIQVIEIPGHTLDHIAYVMPGIIFCGDTLFSAGCGKNFEGTVSQMYNSLQKIAALPDDTKIYCGHEYTVKNLQFARAVEPNNPNITKALKKANKLRHSNLPTLPSTLADEKTFNPFLRCNAQRRNGGSSARQILAKIKLSPQITITSNRNKKCGRRIKLFYILEEIKG